MCSGSVGLRCGGGCGALAVPISGGGRGRLEARLGRFVVAGLDGPRAPTLEDPAVVHRRGLSDHTAGSRCGACVWSRDVTEDKRFQMLLKWTMELWEYEPTGRCMRSPLAAARERFRDLSRGAPMYLGHPRRWRSIIQNEWSASHACIAHTGPKMHITIMADV